MDAVTESLHKRIEDLEQEVSDVNADNVVLTQALNDTTDERDAAVRQVRRMVADRTYVVGTHDAA